MRHPRVLILFDPPNNYVTVCWEIDNTPGNERRCVLEYSVYIIKPPAFKFRCGIRRMIEAAGLSIAEFAEITLRKKDVALLYPSKQGGDPISRHLCDGRSEIGIVYGKRAILRLVKVCGEDTDHLRCKRGTIRLVYGLQIKPILLPDGSSFLSNVVHRSKTSEEAERDLKIANRYFLVH